MREGVSLALVRTVRDICRQTESAPFEVVRAAFRAKRRGYRWTPGPMFLDAGMVAALAPGPVHQPWLDAPAGTGPAKAAHVAALLRVQQLLEPARSSYAPVITPLISQPMLEACLAIPSWQWRDGGRDRAVARDAFAEELPPAVSRRRTKGGPDSFAAAVLNRHRNPIRDRLLDGCLARNHVADRAALEARFRSEIAFSAEETVRLLDLLDTEAWIGAWRSRRNAALSRPARRGLEPVPPSV
jgi:asparagine synthase (glutamine-hydrolysing)